jgi:hypothetical protein
MKQGQESVSDLHLASPAPSPAFHLGVNRRSYLPMTLERISHGHGDEGSLGSTEEPASEAWMGLTSTADVVCGEMRSTSRGIGPFK